MTTIHSMDAKQAFLTIPTIVVDAMSRPQSVTTACVCLPDFAASSRERSLHCRSSLGAHFRELEFIHFSVAVSLARLRAITSSLGTGGAGVKALTAAWAVTLRMTRPSWM